MTPPAIDGTTLRRLVPITDAIDAVAEGFAALSRGEMEQPPRLVLPQSGLLCMTACSKTQAGSVAKLLSVIPANASRDLPTVQGIAVWFDANGTPSLLIDGNSLTALRTGAASGVATRLLAPPDADTLAMLGSGAQAWDQIEAVLTVRDIRAVRIASRNPTTAGALALRLGQAHPGLVINMTRDTREAVRGAQIVCSATTSTTPLFETADLGSSVHINAIGAFTPQMCEIHPDVLGVASLIAVDQRDAALAEAGDIIQAIDRRCLSPDRLVEIGELYAAPHIDAHGWTVFKSVGVATQDWAVARLAWTRFSAQIN